MQTGEIPDICIVCYQEFSEMSKLGKNRFTHVGVKPNMCAISMKRFYKKMVFEKTFADAFRQVALCF